MRVLTSLSVLVPLVILAFVIGFICYPVSAQAGATPINDNCEADETPPDITCPADFTIECDDMTNPGNTGGEAMATDNCSDVNIDFSDVITGNCPVTIQRTWTATDAAGNVSECPQLITANDTTPPVPACNAPATIIPPDAPISFTATATDNCNATSCEITDPDCFTFTKKGKRIDKTESCVVEVDGDTITIQNSGGVGDNIVWTVVCTDACGNVTASECGVEVVNPGQN